MFCDSADLDISILTRQYDLPVQAFSIQLVNMTTVFTWMFCKS